MRPPQILNDDQKEYIRRAFRAGESHKKVAAELHVSRRRVLKYYQQFRGYPLFSHKPLSPDEKQRIRQGYDAHECAKKVAAELGRSTKVVRSYYQKFRGYPARPHEAKKRMELAKKQAAIPPKKSKPLVNESRFYRSDFIPS